VKNDYSYLFACLFIYLFIYLFYFCLEKCKSFRAWGNSHSPTLFRTQLSLGLKKIGYKSGLALGKSWDEGRIAIFPPPFSACPMRLQIRLFLSSSVFFSHSIRPHTLHPVSSFRLIPVLWDT